MRDRTEWIVNTGLVLAGWLAVFVVLAAGAYALSVTGWTFWEGFR